MKILIADDHQIIRHGLKSLLKSIWANAIILETDNLNKAVEILSTTNINLFVLNIGIPNIDVAEGLIGFIAQETKIVIFSGQQGDNERIENLIKAGADICLHKNLSVTEIMAIFLSLFDNIRITKS
ncbi:response regulator [Pedobacter punctiformis]|uniref:Response regulator n=1 Tax=Pedobacter punctiformis TaxID=3004097 RepID=A0ABT4L860_9SPHI|nr:response regulator [Pedobacter sp. HCMS5-2]MCZ4244101.1 response regulator [Pedobacter sp. HCMS5-2]